MAISNLNYTKNHSRYCLILLRELVYKMLKGSLQGSQLITEDPKYLTRINVDNALFQKTATPSRSILLRRRGLRFL